MRVTEPRNYGGQTLEERRRDRRQRFLDAATSLFGTHGYSGTSVPTICKAAGLSSRQFYESFADREDLLRVIYDRMQDESMHAVSVAVREALAANVGVETILDHAISAFVNVYANDPVRIRVNFVEVVGVSPEFEAHRRSRREQWGAMLGAITNLAAQRGLPVMATEPLLWAAYIGAVNAAIVEHADDPSSTVDDVMRVMRRLLRPGVLG